VTDNGNNANLTVAVPNAKRVRASGPILILAIIFVVASFLAWYFTWFGRGLSDTEVTNYLADVNHPRHVQHALLQVQQRIERGDPNAKQWYQQIVRLAGNPEAEIRLTAAWVMGADKSSAEFHEALRKLLSDSEPIVRRNAALALVRFNDASGHAELVAILEPFQVNALADGLLVSSLGFHVSRGDAVMTIRSYEQSVWEALRALAVVGRSEDLAIIERYSGGGIPVSERLKQQAIMTANVIKSRF
jgi:hypothetical protein